MAWTVHVVPGGFGGEVDVVGVAAAGHLDVEVLAVQAGAGEALFATVKNELIYRHPWPTLARTKTAVIAWIEGRYNRRRRHSAIGMRTPVQFETAARHTAAPAA